MNDTVANLFLKSIDELEAEVAVRGECCGCGKGEVEDKIEYLRTLVEIYRESPKRAGY